jgi:cytochrome c peroxidase
MTTCCVFRLARVATALLGVSGVVGCDLPTKRADTPSGGGAEVEQTQAALNAGKFLAPVLVPVLAPDDDDDGDDDEGDDSLRGSLRSLKDVPRPEPSNLSQFVSNRAAAIRLGKAFYWDMQVGSDGMVACATCHHKAGTDGRIRNQIRPRSPLTAGAVFIVGGPNSQVKASDFPFHKLANPDDANSAVLFDGGSNRVASAGIARRLFVDVALGSAVDIGSAEPDPVFNVGGINVRRASIVNAPTNLNAIFNFRQLAAGQGYDTFNGVNTAGVRDSRPLIVKVTDGRLQPVVVRIDNASLASQATGPPLDPVEMSFAGRTWPKLGKKLLTLRPLAKQQVASDDSVLGALADRAVTGRGLLTDYASMIRAAFRPEFWQAGEIVTYSGGSSPDRVAEGAAADAGLPAVRPHPGRALTSDEYTAMEANFSLFWGLALQLYESTLVSDDSPFDRFAERQGSLSPAQRRGMRVFFGRKAPKGGTRATCSNCHGGAEFSNASITAAGRQPIERIVMRDGGTAVRDTGFMNISTRPSTEGKVQGGADPVFGAFSMTVWAQAGYDIGFRLTPPLSPTERVAEDGAIKASSLRNVELTGPYFHTGGAATLRQVVDFYVRGGDFAALEPALDPSLVPLTLSERNRDDLVEFLRALTDPRVRVQAAPFDHPQILLPSGHRGDDRHVIDDGSGRAIDDVVEVPAVGSGGGTALQSFLGLDPRQP